MEIYAEEKRVNREQILDITKDIFKESSIVATLNSKLSPAIEAFTNGYTDDSIRYQINKGNPVTMCDYKKSYGYFNNECNLIVSVPREFIMTLLDFSDEEYAEFVFNMNTDLDKVNVIMGVSQFWMLIQDPVDYNHCYEMVIPKEFIKGAIIFDQELDYASFIKNPEIAFDHISYVANPNFYTNLDEEKKEIFVNEVQNRIEKGNGWVESNSLRRYR